MSTVNIERETIVVYSITLPGEPEPIVLRVPAVVARDLWLELEDLFNPGAKEEPIKADAIYVAASSNTV